MNTLIIPCAGKSSRFPNMKPKWLLTHPDGELMIQKAISGLNLEIYDRIVFTIVKEHAERYDAKLILEQIFGSDKRCEILVLDNFTKSAGETIYNTLTQKNITGSFVVKDSDNFVKVVIPQDIQNQVVGLNLQTSPNVSNIPGKSFLVINEQNILQDIIEKKIVSSIIGIGVYAFANAEDYLNTYKAVTAQESHGELYLSHIISYMISQNTIFIATMATGYEDWGTLNEWRDVQNRYKTYFVDIDGVLLKNAGKYGRLTWRDSKEVLVENIESLRKLQENGAQIVITTSRTEEYRSALESLLNEYQLTPHAIVMGLNHASRVLINDFASTNPYPSCEAISIPRNGSLKEYLSEL